MADQKLTELIALTAPIGSDLLYMVDDPGGTPISSKVTLDNLRKAVSGRVAFARRTAGDLTLNSTAWANLQTGLDLTLAGVLAGDVIEVGFSGRCNNEAVAGGIDVVSLVSAAPVNAWGQNGAEQGSGLGIAALNFLASQADALGGSIMRAAVAGDLSGGTLTLRWRYRTTTGANKTMRANADHPLDVWAKNHGQQA
jgi:hypothetical protein